MKNLKTILVAIFALTIFVSPVKAVSMPDEIINDEVCTPVGAPDPLEYKKGGVQYKWFETSEGTWTLKFDIDPRGGHEIWVNANKTHNEVTCPEPEEPVCDEGQVYNEELDVCENTETPVEEEIPVIPTPQPDTTDHNSAGTGSGSAPVCSDSVPSIGIAHASVTRLTGETALVQWTIHSGNQTHIVFGETGEGWKHAALNIGMSGNFTVSGLHADRTYDWQVIPMNGCTAGSRSPIIKGL